MKRPAFAANAPKPEIEVVELKMKIAFIGLGVMGYPDGGSSAKSRP